MKKFFGAIATVGLALAIGVNGVDALTDTKKINKDACDTVYTNYYFFLEANTEGYFEGKTSRDTRHKNLAKYTNNYYEIRNFNTSNVGYGQVTLNASSGNSRDGITSMSLEEFYRLYKKGASMGGAFREGNNNYMVSRNSYSISNGKEVAIKSGVSFSDASIRDLVNATANADVTITRRTKIAKRYENPFELEIERQYYGLLSGKPVQKGDYYWYLQPALYYVQYCSSKTERDSYKVVYDGNATNVTNVPSTDYAYYDECMDLSSSKPRRSGYTFLGWSTNSKATSPDRYFDPGNEYCGEEGDLRLYAVWRKDRSDVAVTYYTVSYKTNTTDTVTNMPSDITANTNSNVYLASEAPVRSGYEFLGWSPDSRSTTGDSNYRGGSLYTDRKDLVLYAIWKKIENKPDPIIPDNPQTGIADYLVPFGGVISASGLGLGILKKKKAFKQF